MPNDPQIDHNRVTDTAVDALEVVPPVAPQVGLIDARSAVIEVVRFDSERDNEPKAWSGPLGELLGIGPEVREEKTGRGCFSPARYRAGASRGNPGVEALTAITLDFDHVQDQQLRQVFECLSAQQVLFAAYTSHSDRANGVDDRCARVIVLPNRPLEPNEYQAARAALVERIGVPADPHAADPARLWFLPTSPAARADGAFIYYSRGRPLDVEPLLAEDPGEPAAGVAAEQGASTTTSQLRSRLRHLRDPESRDILAPVLEGQVFAEPGERNATLWKILSIAAFAAPDVEEARLVELVLPSLERTNERTPDDQIPVSVVEDMARRALEDARSRRSRMLERGDETEIGQELLEALGDRAHIVSAEGEIHRYNQSNGIWDPLPDEYLSCVVQAFAGRPIVGAREARPLKVDTKMVKGSVKLASDRVKDRRFFEGAAKGFAFKNGFVHVDATGIRLEPHKPEDRARACLDYNYDPAAPMPQFHQFLEDIFAPDQDAPQKKLLLQEFAGAALVGMAATLAKVVVLLGAGRNGKSTFIDILLSLFPKTTQAFVPPQLWEREYYRAQLRGKLINAVGELPKADLIHGEAFKAVVAGDPVIGRPIYKEPVQFRPVAGHIMAANALPGSDDLSPAFWARFLIITFNRRFEDHEQVKGLAQRIITAESPGLLAWALAGAVRLISQGERTVYTEPPSHGAVIEEWKLRADQVRQFITDKTDPTNDPQRRTSASELYRHYKIWAENEGHRVLASNKFGERVKALGVRFVKPHSVGFYCVAVKGMPHSQWTVPPPLPPDHQESEGNPGLPGAPGAFAQRTTPNGRS